MKQFQLNSLVWLLLLVIVLPRFAAATILPEERADILYHEYDGGGVTIDGPSLLVRKNFIDKVSISANYYVDNVTSASIDVETYGSPYTEERTEQTVGVDMLGDKNIMSFSYTTSSENDYEAETYFFGISQDFFGDLTNISIGYGLGNDEIRATGQPDFEEELERQNYRVSVSQIITKRLIMGLNFELVTEEGYIQNPYRKSLILRQEDRTFAEIIENEEYPDTRTSDAVSIRFKYYLPYRAAFRTEFRYYSDSWDIQGRNIEFGYTHPLESYPITLDFKYRFYKQSDASFYFDFVDRSDGSPVPDFHARDKELSSFETLTFGFGVKWEFLPDGWSFIDNASVSLNYDHMEFKYDNFSDARIVQSLDTDLSTIDLDDIRRYEFDASVIRFYFTAVY